MSGLADAPGRPADVAVVGAGISGLACARALAGKGLRVRVFDKGRGVGGRMSTRRRGEWRFDHGAQYFTARDRRFGEWVQRWRRKGIVARWEGDIAVVAQGAVRLGEGRSERWVGRPGMSAVCRHLGAGLEISTETRVGALIREGEGWLLTARDRVELGRYDAVAIAAPAPQAATLLQAPAPELAAAARRVTMSPCWAALVVFPEPLGLDFDGAFVEDSALSWIARNASKPDRPAAEAWVLHAGPKWSSNHLDAEPETAARRLLDALAAALGGLAVEPIHLEAHRWRFALPADPLGEDCLFDPGLRIGACGDWCVGPRVEGAFLSGCALAGRLLRKRPVRR